MKHTHYGLDLIFTFWELHVIQTKLTSQILIIIVAEIVFGDFFRNTIENFEKTQNIFKIVKAYTISFFFFFFKS